jgi:hypothetical protein
LRSEFRIRQDAIESRREGVGATPRYDESVFPVEDDAGGSGNRGGYYREASE